MILRPGAERAHLTFGGTRMKRVVRWIGVLLGAVVALVVVAAAGLYASSTYRLSRTYTVPTENLAVPRDAATVARGEHLVIVHTKCGDCHGVDLGGAVFIDDPALGRVPAPNLTAGRGGVGLTFSDADYARAIRHGIAPDGHPLLVMPADDWARMSDEDTAAVIAYVRSVPPVDRELPPLEVRPLGRALIATGQLPLPADLIDHAAQRPPAPPPGPTAEYGGYLAEIGGCRGCHGPGLSGGRIPGTPPEIPPATNITPTGIGSWAEQDFVRALRTGARPDGSRIDPFMPWGATSKLSDDELHALWLYVHAVPPKATGTR
jgi:mono/diheme cytochrome c family protein